MNLALYGYGGHAREVAAQLGKKITFFVDDEYVTQDTQPISTFDPNNHLMMVAVADPKKRQHLVATLPQATRFFTFIHPTVLLLDRNIEIGEGSFIGANSILTTNIKIGKHALLNRCVQVGHDTVIGDYFSAMPGVTISGNVTIQNSVYIGSNSSVREGITINNHTIIGLSSGVVHDIEQPGTYGGVPAKKLKI